VIIKIIISNYVEYTIFIIFWIYLNAQFITATIVHNQLFRHNQNYA
jgi:hypothetical protein